MTLFEYVSDNDASSKMAGTSSESEVTSSQFIQVPVKKYDNLGLTITPDLLIMDVEGFEYEVLQGMENLLKGLQNCDIIIEIMPHTPTKNETMKLMESFGFNKHKRVDDHDCHFWKE